MTPSRLSALIRLAVDLVLVARTGGPGTKRLLLPEMGSTLNLPVSLSFESYVHNLGYH